MRRISIISCLCLTLFSVGVSAGFKFEPASKEESDDLETFNPTKKYYRETVLTVSNGPWSGKLWLDSYRKVNGKPKVDYSIGLSFSAGETHLTTKLAWRDAKSPALGFSDMSGDVFRPSLFVYHSLNNHTHLYGNVQYSAVMDNKKANGFYTSVGVTHEVDLGLTSFLTKVKGGHSSRYGADYWHLRAELTSHHKIDNSISLGGPGIRYAQSRYGPVFSWKLFGVSIKW